MPASTQLLFTTGGLLLVLVLLVAGRARQRLLENLQDLLILDLLVSLELGQVGGVGGSKLGDAILGDSYKATLDLFQSAVIW